MDSVLLEFSMFPTDVGESKSEYVSKVIDFIDKSGVKYKLTPMSTIIETGSMQEALELVAQASEVLGEHSNRIYSCIKIDYRKNSDNRMGGKIASVENKLNREVKK